MLSDKTAIGEGPLHIVCFDGNLVCFIGSIAIQCDHFAIVIHSLMQRECRQCSKNAISSTTLIFLLVAGIVD